MTKKTVFSKRHYEVIAKEIKEGYSEYAKRLEKRLSIREDKYINESFVNCLALEALAHRLIKQFELDNPSFDKRKFLKACGMRVPSRVKSVYIVKENNVENNNI